MPQGFMAYPVPQKMHQMNGKVTVSFDFPWRTPGSDPGFLSRKLPYSFAKVAKISLGEVCFIGSPPRHITIR